MVRRSRLLARLDLAARRRLTILVAPIGYGKTVLLSQWAATASAPRIRWLAPDPADHADGFGRTLLSVLAPEDGDRSEAPALESVDAPQPWLNQLARDLRELPPTTLVIDDLHLLADPVALELFEQVAEHAPPSLRLIVATQHDLPRLFYRHRLTDDLAELRQEDLAFDLDEGGALLRTVSGRPLSPAHIEAVWERTEGWAIGLQLAAVALRDGRDVDAFVTEFVDSDRHIADFLTTQVLERQTEPVRRFLLTTSALERLHPELCDRVTEHHDSQQVLAELLRTSLFITRIPGEEPWWRYHPLFRSLLRHRLRAHDPAGERRVLERAAEWYLERHATDAAMHHLAEARSWDRIVEHTRGEASELLLRDQADVVGRSLAKVPAEIRREQPETALLEAATSILTGDPRSSGRGLEHLLGRPDLNAGERTVGTLLRAYRARRRGAVHEALADAGWVLRSLDTDGATRYPNVFGLTGTSMDLTAAAQLVRGEAALYDGDLTTAARALTIARDRGAAPWQVEVLGHLALLRAWGGELRAAEALASRALALAHNVGPGLVHMTAEAYLALARVARERWDLDAAADLAHQAARLASSRACPVTDHLVTTERGLLLAETARPEDGLLFLTSRRHRRPPVQPSLIEARRRVAEARLSLRLGDLDGAERALSPPPDPLSEAASVRMQIHLSRGDTAAAESQLADWPAHVAPRAAWERDLWIAVVAQLEGREQDARDRFAAVVADTEPHRHLGVFSDAGTHVHAVARALYRVEPSLFVRRIVERAGSTPHRPSPVRELPEQLTEREQALLTLLPTRLTNAEMAADRGVSVNTTKTHLKHIYRKLGVSSRRDAVTVAERLRLL